MHMGEDSKQRVAAVAHDGTGAERYRLLRAGAERAAKAFRDGYYVEAVVITESMLWCRVASRLTYVEKAPTEKTWLPKLMERVAKADGEPDAAEFQALFVRIDRWLQDYRNPLTHATSKLLAQGEETFEQRMARAKDGAVQGFELLADLERVDMQSRLRNGWQSENPTSRVRPPASAPDAFDPVREIVGRPTAASVLAGDRRTIQSPAPSAPARG